MAFSVAEDAIKSKVLAAWTRPSVPVYWLSQGQVVPTGPYAMIFIEGHREELVAFGGGRGQNEYITYGSVHGFFFVPLNGPVALAQAMRDEFCGALRSEKFSNVSILGVTPIGGGGDSDEAKHFNLQALAMFEYRFKG